MSSFSDGVLIECCTGDRMMNDAKMPPATEADKAALKKLEASLRTYYGKLGLDNIDGLIRARLERARSRRLMQFVTNMGVDFRGKNVLDVGCGWGEFLLTMREFGAASTTGVEPDASLVELSRVLSPESRVLQGFSEVLPFESNSFDVVLSSDVIEHVSNADIALAEMIRVLKPGGYALLNFPNYAYFEESHYKMAFPPGGLRRAGAMYLRLKGRDPSFYLHCVNPVFYRDVMRTLSLFDVDIQPVHDELHVRAGRRPMVERLKQAYVRRFGPPVVSLIIRKNSHGRSIGQINFV